MAEKPNSKPFAVGDSATTAHIKEALGRGSPANLKAVEAELRAKGFIPPAKSPTATPRKP
jgi:hypothetical protein